MPISEIAAKVGAKTLYKTLFMAKGEIDYTSTVHTVFDSMENHLKQEVNNSLITKRYDMEHVIRLHTFFSKRTLDDGSEPIGPDWNPGCRCGEGMYFFEHDEHLTTKLLEVLTGDKNE